MISVQHHDKLLNDVASMSELELDSFLSDLKNQIEKRGLPHLLENIFGSSSDDIDDEIESLLDEISHLKSELDDYKDNILKIYHLSVDAKDIDYTSDGGDEREVLLEKEVEELKKVMDEISDLSINL